MEKILLDTNILLAVRQFNIDIFSEIDRICSFSYEIAILDRCVEELENIFKKQSGKDREAAKIALQLIDIKNVKVIETNSKKNADDLILGLSKKNGYIVATQDKDLKRKLVNQGSSVIVMKSKKMLDIINGRGF